MNFTSDNIILYAAKVYNNPGCVSFKEFEEDYSRVKYLKVLFAKYLNNKKVNMRIILNHIICLNNVFPGAAAKILFAEVETKYWNLVATFLVYLSLMPIEDFKINGEVLNLDSFQLEGNLYKDLEEL